MIEFLNSLTGSRSTEVHKSWNRLTARSTAQSIDITRERKPSWRWTMRWTDPTLWD